MAELADLIDEFKKAPPAGKALAVVAVVTVAGLGLYVAHMRHASSSGATTSGAGVLPVDVSSALGGDPGSGIPFPNFPASTAPAQVGAPTDTGSSTGTSTSTTVTGGEQGTYGILGPNVQVKINANGTGTYLDPSGKWVSVPLQAGQKLIQGSSNRVWIQDTKNNTQSLLTSGTGAPIDITNSNLKNFASHPIAGAYSVSPAPVASH